MRPFAVILAIIGPALAAAAEPISAGAADPLPDQPDVTYIELLRQIAPDLHPAADGAFQGTLAGTLPYVSGGDPSAEAGYPITVDRVATLRFRAEGRDRLLVLVDLGEADRAESFTALALIEAGPEPRVLDFVDVSWDRFTDFPASPLLDLSADDQAVLIHNSHSNSNQSYDSTQILFVHGGKIRLAGSVSAFSDWSCSFRHLQTASFEVVADPGARYAAIRASVLDELSATGFDCEEQSPSPFSRTVSAAFRWDGAGGAFVADSDALDKLAREDGDRY